MYHNLTNKNDVYYLTQPQDKFEDAYIAIREKEGRILSDEEVFSLPHLPIQHPKRKEWQKRNFTIQKILPYFETFSPTKILDLGCGNGWFTNLLAQATTAEITGADVNIVELEQAARLFGGNHCHFIYADIFSDQWTKGYFDIITLNACVQYFPNLDELILQLKQLLTSNGEIHFLDSPFYNTNEINQAQQRTKTYYQQQGVAEMIPFYHHHSWGSLERHKPQIRFQPNSLFNKVAAKLNKNRSPFPWIIIPKKGLVSN